MSAISSYPLVPLLVGTAAVAVGCAALQATRRLRREVAALRHELAGQRTGADAAGNAAPGMVPGARTASHSEEIRTAVAEALAEERERELAEARAFWAAQESGDTTDTSIFDGSGFDIPGFDGPGSFGVPDHPGSLGPSGDSPAGRDHPGTGEGTGATDHCGPPGFEALPFLPRQADRQADGVAGGEAEAPFTPSQRRHPSDPEFAPAPVVAGYEQTVARLTALAEAATPLADVRPGPLGTLDLYVFTDGTTLCLTPGHRETAQRLTGALERGEAPVLLGGSGVSGGYALTFTYGAESVFILADRVVASL